MDSRLRLSRFFDTRRAASRQKMHLRPGLDGDAVETRAADTAILQGLPIDAKHAAGDRRIAAKFGLPEVVN